MLFLKKFIYFSFFFISWRLITLQYCSGFWTLWEKARVGCFKRTPSKHVYYLGWNRSPAQVGCMRQALGPGALGRPRGIGWRGRWEGGSGWGTHVNPWLIHFNVLQNPLQYCKELMLLNCGVGEDSWESIGLQGDPTSPSKRESVLNIHWKHWCWSWNSNT